MPTASPADLDRSRGQALILVVERDPHVQRLERFFLEQAGFAVAFAADGLEALAFARAHRPEIVVAEVLVPRLDGLALCRELRADPATARIRVLIFSILQVEARARDAGADAFLRKPLDDESLIGTVRALLADHPAAEAARRSPE